MSNRKTIAAWSEISTLWSSCVATVLGQVSGKEFQGSPLIFPETPAAEDPEDGSSRWFILEFEKRPEGEMALHVDRTSAIGMAQLLMGDPFDPSMEFSPDYEDALTELVRQFCGSMAVALKAAHGQEVPVRLKGTAAPEWEKTLYCEVDLAASDTTTVRLRMMPSPELIRSLAEPNAASTADLKTGRVAEPESSPASSSNPAADAAALELQDDLGMLRDISLNAHLSFGDHTMPLSDVLGCLPGSVIESDRPPEMPVELWVEGILAARGDIVIVNGNYGVRVRELCNSEPRRSSLSKGTVLSA